MQRVGRPARAPRRRAPSALWRAARPPHCPVSSPPLPFFWFFFVGPRAARAPAGTQCGTKAAGLAKSRHARAPAPRFFLIPFFPSPSASGPAGWGRCAPFLFFARARAPRTKKKRGRAAFSRAADRRTPAGARVRSDGDGRRARPRGGSILVPRAGGGVVFFFFRFRTLRGWFRAHRNARDSKFQKVGDGTRATPQRSAARFLRF